MELGITKEEILELAAQKLADMHYQDSGSYDWVSRVVNERIGEVISTKVNKEIDRQLEILLPKILNDKITPVNIWGEKAGEPTTIKDVLQQRALTYWDAKVDDKGKPCSSYYGKTRAQFMVTEALKEELSKALNENIKSVIAAMKESLKADAIKQADKLINNAIRS